MRRVALFAKRPETGRVKTRLSPALPARLARDLYAAMLADALAAASGCGADQVAVYWAPAGETSGTGTIPSPADLGPGVSVAIEHARAHASVVEREQEGPDLGTRLERAFGALLRTPGDRAVAIGADCPLLDAATLRQAFDELEDHDVVLGPSRDGGYYLVGLAGARPRVFQGITWSTERVLAETLERAENEDARVVLLRTLDDLDTPADLVGLAARSLALRGAAPHTLEALRTMGLAPPAV